MRSKKFYAFLVALLRFPLFLVFRYKLINKNNMPLEGRYIIASNHMTGPDCIYVGLGQKRQIRFMAKAELFEKPFPFIKKQKPHIEVYICHFFSFL